MGETRKIAAILVADVVGYSRLAGADEEGTLARLRALRSDLIDPAIAAHHGRTVKRTGDGTIIEFRSVVDAVRCAVDSAERHGRAQCGRRARQADGVSRRNSLGRCGRGSGRRPHGRRRQPRRTARRSRRAGRRLPLRGRLASGARQARGSLRRPRRETAQEHCAADARLRAKSWLATARPAPPSRLRTSASRRVSRWSFCRSPISAATRSRSISSTGSRRASRPTSRGYEAPS